jgi:APA family basic amino acid/polyamine antiporter
VCFALAGAALMVFRRARPDAPRPFKAPRYPAIPRIFTVAGLGVVVNTFVDDPRGALEGTAIIALGAPVFFVWPRFARRARERRDRA